jgi:hypothetical protein
MFSNGFPGAEPNSFLKWGFKRFVLFLIFFFLLGNLGGYSFSVTTWSTSVWRKWITESKERKASSKVKKFEFSGYQWSSPACRFRSTCSLLVKKQRLEHFFETCKMYGILWIKWNKSFIQDRMYLVLIFSFFFSVIFINVFFEPSINVTECSHLGHENDISLETPNHLVNCKFGLAHWSGRAC